MNPHWLLLPYCILLVMEGARFFLLEHALNDLIEQIPVKNRLNRFRALNIKWYRWLLRFGKDWVVLGILGGVAVSGLKQFIPLITPYTLAALGLILLLCAYAPTILWHFISGVRVPGLMLSSAVWMAVPDRVPAGRRRVALWGAIFFMAGISSIMVGIKYFSMGFLLWGCINLTLSFISLFKSISKQSDGMEDSQNAEKAG